MSILYASYTQQRDKGISIDKNIFSDLFFVTDSSKHEQYKYISIFNNQFVKYISVHSDLIFCKSHVYTILHHYSVKCTNSMIKIVILFTENSTNSNIYLSFHRQMLICFNSFSTTLDTQ